MRNKPKIVCHRHGGPELRLVRVRVGRVMSIGNGPSTTERRHGSALQLGGGAAAGAFGHERNERDEYLCTKPKIAIRRPDTAEICSEADRPPLADLSLSRGPRREHYGAATRTGSTARRRRRRRRLWARAWRAWHARMYNAQDRDQATKYGRDMLGGRPASLG